MPNPRAIVHDPKSRVRNALNSLSRSLNVSPAPDSETLVLYVPVLERCQRLAG